MAKTNVCARCYGRDFSTENKAALKCNTCGSTGPFMLLDEQEAARLTVRTPIIGPMPEQVKLPAWFRVFRVISVTVLLLLVFLWIVGVL